MLYKNTESIRRSSCTTNSASSTNLASNAVWIGCVVPGVGSEHPMSVSPTRCYMNAPALQGVLRRIDDSDPDSGGELPLVPAGVSRYQTIASGNGLQTFVGNDIEEFECRPCGMGFTLLPFAYGRSRRVQKKCKHRLTELQGFAQAFDVRCTKFPDRRRADRVELAHRHLADRSRFVERSQIATQGFNDLAHNAPPITPPTAVPSTRPRRKVQETPCRRTAMPSSRPA